VVNAEWQNRGLKDNPLLPGFDLFLDTGRRPEGRHFAVKEDPQALTIEDHTLCLPSPRLPSAVFAAPLDCYSKSHVGPSRK
jgi:hypothetical protein